MSEPRLRRCADQGNSTPWWGVHAARYRFANQLLPGSIVVFDAACGTGYGLEVLGTKGRTAIGMDIDASAFDEIKSQERLILADGCKLPLKAAAVDAVTSFETIEHLSDPLAFLSEISRVLKPYGMLLMSTPNANYTQPINGVPTNPYHLFEFNPSEFACILTRYFAEVRLLGQTIAERFVISPFADDQRRLPRTLRNRSRVLVWRILNKLPPALRDAASQVIWGHALYPSERDYDFASDTLDTAPVLLALAREPCRQ